jgi:transposase
MSKPPKKRSPEFKMNLAVEALKNDQSIKDLAAKHGLHPRQITRWRSQLLDEAQNIFVHKATQKRVATSKEKKELLQIIEQLSSELTFLKKKLNEGPQELV